MRIIITGATGFVGKELVKNLEKHEILQFSRRLGYDISKKEDLEKAFKFEPDAVIHLAVLSNHFAKWKMHERITVNGTKNIVNFCNEYDCRLIYMASCASKAKGKTNYSLAKKIADTYVLENANNFVAFRPSVIYDYENLEKLSKLYRIVPKNVVINPIYRKTIVSALVAALRKGSGLYEIGDKNPVKLEDFAKAIRKNVLVVPKFVFKSLKPFLYFSNIFSKPFGIELAGLIDYLIDDRICNTKKFQKDFKIEQVDTLEKIKELRKIYK